MAKQPTYRGKKDEKPRKKLNMPRYQTPNTNQLITPTAPVFPAGSSVPVQAPSYWSDYRPPQYSVAGGNITIRAPQNHALAMKLQELGFRFRNGVWVGRDTVMGRKLAQRF